jgi:hypothetical protein
MVPTFLLAILTRPPDGGRRARRLHGILDDEVAVLGVPDGEGDMIRDVCQSPDLRVCGAASLPLFRQPIPSFLAMSPSKVMTFSRLPVVIPSLQLSGVCWP